MAEHTEQSLLAALERRYCREVRGNGPAWAFVAKVRDAAGFSATRTMDALAMSLWPSRGLELHGHEIKCSRSDWLRELADPSKAEAFTRYVDRWWIVAGDVGIVRDGELPPTWGLMVARGRGLVVKTKAPVLPATDAEWMPRTFLAALLRAAGRTSEADSAEVDAAVASARASWDKQHADGIERWRAERDELERRIRDFEDASGLSLRRHLPADVGVAVRAVLDGEVDAQRYLDRFAGLATTAERIAKELRVAAGTAANG